MYSARNGYRPAPEWSEYGAEFVARYRAAQIERVARIDARARLLAQDAEDAERPRVEFEVNEQVKINDGPFLNYTGVVEEIDADKGKLKVTISIFGRNTPVELEYWQVEKVEE